jgi:hypothetical protein
MRTRTDAAVHHAHHLLKVVARHHHHLARADRSAPEAPLLSGLAHVVGAFWLPGALLAIAAVLVVAVGRVWGRHRMARAGCWFEARLGEEVSRPALESFLRTLAHGLRRPLLGGVPWVALSVSAEEDRAACGLFVSGGLSAPQVRTALEQALGGVTVKATASTVRVGDDARRRRVVASLRAVGSRFLPLRVDQRVDPAGQLLAALRAQSSGEGGVIQLGIAGAATVRAGTGATPGSGASRWAGPWSQRWRTGPCCGRRGSWPCA